MKTKNRRRRALEVLKAAQKRDMPVFNKAEHAVDHAEKKGDAFCQNTWGSINLCGTASCAGGLLALDVELARDGLRPVAYPVDLEPKYEGATGVEALADFFEISHSDAKLVFGPTSQFVEPTRTLKETTKRLRRAFKDTPL